jgi:hypothetical protein
LLLTVRGGENRTSSTATYRSAINGPSPAGPRSHGKTGCRDGQLDDLEIGAMATPRTSGRCTVYRPDLHIAIHRDSSGSAIGSAATPDVQVLADDDFGAQFVPDLSGVGGQRTHQPISEMCAKSPARAATP